MKSYILVVDDEPDIRRLVREILEDEDYSVVVAKDGAAARECVKKRAPSLILLDIWMPDVDGITLLKEFFSVYKLSCPVVMMSGHGTVEAAVESTRLGATDFIEKPLSLSKLLVTVEQALASDQSPPIQSSPKIEVIDPVELIGKSEISQKLKDRLDQCAQHDVTVIITGENGVGKSHCSRYIHSNSARKSGPYIEFHTASFVNDNNEQGAELLLGSDQSSEQKVGLLEQASSGTLYIDDIGELDHVAQTALYGALTSPVTYRMGSERAINVDVRVIVATRFNLEEEVQAGHFREDLFYCLNAYPLHVAPLREHSEDVSELVQYYVNLFADQGGLPYRNFTVAAQNALRNYHWPGNVLELEYFVRRILTQGAEPTIERDEVEAMLDEAANKAIGFQTGPVPEFELPLRQAREHFEIAYLSYHLNQAGGSVGKVAKVVGMERTHLYRKLRTLGIDAKDYPKNVKQ